MKLSLSVKYNELKAIGVFASQDTARYSMMGVQVEVDPDGVTLVATTGFTLGALRLSALSILESVTEPVSFIVPNLLLKRMTRTTNPMILGLDGDAVSIEADGFLIGAKKINGTYPNWKQSVPKWSPSPITTIALSPLLLSRFYAAQKLLGGNGMLAFQHGGNDCYSIHFPGTEDFLGMLMPMRTKHEINGFPAWIPAKSE